MDLKEIRKILILRGEGALGDAIISSFIFREIKRKYPKIKIDAVAFGACADYYSKNKYIDNLYRLPIRNKIRSYQHWPELMWEAFKLRLKKYDLVVDSSNKTSINWHAFKWLCSKKDGLFDIRHNNGNFGDFKKHRVEHEKLVFESIGLKDLNIAYDIYSSDEANKNIIDWKSANNITNLICINVFGSVKERTFNKQTIDSIVSYLDNKEYKFVIPCMPKQANEAKSLISEKNRFNCFVYETKDVFELISLIQNSSMVFTPDTAALHIASGLNKPTVAFYNNYTEYYAPNNPLAKIIKTAKDDVNDFNIDDLKATINQIAI